MATDPPGPPTTPEAPDNPSTPRWLRLACALLAGSIAGALTFVRADLDEPPRFDGAGYAMLGKSLAMGLGYREVFHPDQPPHTHYPPGYPIALAALWTLSAPTSTSAHLGSIAATAIAVGLMGLWFARHLEVRAALPLSLALAVNWQWTRVGSAIQTEPLFLLLSALALNLFDAVISPETRAKGSTIRNWLVPTILLGAVLGASILVRHIGLALTLAFGWELLFRRRFAQAAWSTVVAGLMTLPWVLWIANADRRSQADLLLSPESLAGLDDRLVFYVRRLPDQVVGPFVEVATVFNDNPTLAAVGTAIGVAATALLAWGLIALACRPTERPAVAVVGVTMPILLVWPFTEAGRFLIPLVPLLLLGFASGLVEVAQRFLKISRAKTWPIASTLLLAASLPYPMLKVVQGERGLDTPADQAFDAAYQYVLSEEASRDEGDPPRPVLMAQNAAEAAWITGRPALPPPNGLDAEAFLAMLDDDRIGFLIVGGDRFANDPGDPLALALNAHETRDRLVPVWTDSDDPEPLVTVYRVRP